MTDKRSQVAHPIEIEMTPAMLERAEVFDGAPQASSASKFGTVGINFRADRP